MIFNYFQRMMYSWKLWYTTVFTFIFFLFRIFLIWYWKIGLLRLISNFNYVNYLLHILGFFQTLYRISIFFIFIIVICLICIVVLTNIIVLALIIHAHNFIIRCIFHKNRTIINPVSFSFILGQVSWYLLTDFETCDAIVYAKFMISITFLFLFWWRPRIQILAKIVIFVYVGHCE